ETPQQAAIGAHSRVGKGHCRSEAPSNSNSLSAPLPGLEPAHEPHRGGWKALWASSVLIAGIVARKKLRQTPIQLGGLNSPMYCLSVAGTATRHLGSSFVVSS